MSETPQRSKIVFTITAIVTGLIFYFGVQHLMAPDKPDFEQEMVKIAADINQRCPLMMDAATRLDNVVAIPGKTFQYNITLLNVDVEHVVPDSMKAFITPRIIKNIKTNPDLEQQRQNQVTMSYLYKDKQGTSMFKVVITPEMYQ